MVSDVPFKFNLLTSTTYAAALTSRANTKHKNTSVERIAPCEQEDVVKRQAEAKAKQEANEKAEAAAQEHTRRAAEAKAKQAAERQRRRETREREQRAAREQAQKDAKKLSAAGLKPKAQKLLGVLSENPFQNPPSYEKLVGDLAGACSRRINIKHRLVYQVLEDIQTVKVLRMWTHYE